MMSLIKVIKCKKKIVQDSIHIDSVLYYNKYIFTHILYNVPYQVKNNCQKSIYKDSTELSSELSECILP